MLCGDASHVAVVGKQRSTESGRYPEELCEAYATLVISQFRRIAKAEFYAVRERELEEEVRELKEKTINKRASDPRPPLQRPSKAKRMAPKEEPDEHTEGKPKPKTKAKA